MAEQYLNKYKSLLNQIDLHNVPDTYSRKNGTHDPKRRTPHISGYWYLMLKMPKELTDKTQDYAKYFNACAQSFSPPSRSLTKEEIIGFAGIKKYVINSQEISNSFSITFHEHKDLDVFNMLSHWSSVVNPYTGQIIKKYKGQCIVILAKPTLTSIPNEEGKDFREELKKSIDEIFFFDGVFPESQPIDKLDSDISTNDVKSIDVTFNFDGCFMSKVFDLDAFLDDFIDVIEEFKAIDPYLEMA